MKNNVVKKSILSTILDILLPFYCRGCGKTGSLLCDDCRKKIKIIGSVGEGEKARGGRTGANKGDWVPGEKKIELGEIEELFVGGFREGALKRLVEDYKFKSTKRAAEVLAGILDEAVSEECGKAREWVTLESPGEGRTVSRDKMRTGASEVVVVPLPTIRKHIRERGFDHTRRLAEEFGRRRGIEVWPVLIRMNKTVQVGADEKTREKQAAEAYAVDEKLWGRLGKGPDGEAKMAEKGLAAEAKMAGKGPDSDGVQKLPTFLLLDDVWTTGASMRAAALKLREAGAERILGCVVEMGR